VTNNYFFQFSYQEWPMATCLEVMKNQLNSGLGATLIDLTGKCRFEYEFPIADRFKIILVRTRLKKSKIYTTLRSEYPTKFRVLSDSPNFDSKPDATLNKLAAEVAYLELIAVVREAEPSREKHKDRLRKYKQTFIHTYLGAIEILNKEKVDSVYLYNGRFLQERAVWEACLFLQIPIIFYEKFNPSWKNRYFLFQNPTHSPSYRSSIMLDFGVKFRDEDFSRYTAVGSKWFEGRMLGITQDYTKKQKDIIPLKFAKPFVVFFHSSEDELITTDLQSKTWGNQISALHSLIEVLEGVTGLNLIIRAHPNLLHKSKNEIELWRSLGAALEAKYSWISYVDSDSSISSYGLMMQAESIITVGSTIGVEAAFWGKKSILIGRAFHESMGMTLNPENLDQLREMLQLEFTQDEILARRSRALDYAVFHELGGDKFSNIEYSVWKNKDQYNFGRLILRQPIIASALMRLDTILREIKRAK
jgi:hypothetical protein